tara:strand:+ start:724 stop:930 length:207 start_codon:yes stop_codon:yes gene_type:complete
MTYPNPISSPYVLFKAMKQPKTKQEIKQERRAIIENAWFNHEIDDQQLEAEYKALGIKLPSQNRLEGA